ncbi:alcohol oxidase [Sistotremastrum suecicum HHB10207 ss-3]|uniref:Alcohol oxidase n=1 Tax=Sistotremastrum suecicum HHB10207 ss-3 TaxID=1314776 RepID=A0A166A2S2_9AGAM|nr:alcohol oxidase [Sistotremastrum suecicum HHB10207 ss-3]
MNTSRILNLLSAVALLSLLQVCSAGLLTDPAAVSNKKYDFVIVGGGTAGVIMAARITENPRHTVLLIESGASHENIPLPLRAPALGVRSGSNEPWTWNHTIVPQIGLENRTFTYQTGHILGGSSYVYGLYTRSTDQIYDKIAKVSGDNGWSWNSLVPYFNKAEGFILPGNGSEWSGSDFESSAHGTRGPFNTRLPIFPNDIDPFIAQLVATVPGFSKRHDISSGKALGVGVSQPSITKAGSASNVATGYLTPDVLARQNLDIITGARATKLTFKSSPSGPVANGVQFTPSPNANTTSVFANNEIILSAGAFNTPQLLQLSGIGSSTLLKSLKVPVILNSPQVGRNLRDHVTMPMQWLASVNTTLDRLQNATFVTEQTALWESTGAGILTASVANHLGFFRVNSSVFDAQTGDPSAGPDCAHYEFLFRDCWQSFTLPYPGQGSYVSMGMQVTSTSSIGTVTINTTNPFTSPLIDPQYFTSPTDIKIGIQGVRAARQAYGSPIFKDILVREFGPNPNATTDAEIEAMLRHSGTTLFHAVGTAQMAAFNSGVEKGVVNPDLTVKGVKGLRIVDASVIPVLPDAHTLAPVLAFAERGADLVKAAWP